MIAVQYLAKRIRDNPGKYKKSKFTPEEVREIMVLVGIR